MQNFTVGLVTHEQDSSEERPLHFWCALDQLQRNTGQNCTSMAIIIIKVTRTVSIRKVLTRSCDKIHEQSLKHTALWKKRRRLSIVLSMIYWLWCDISYYGAYTHKLSDEANEDVLSLNQENSRTGIPFTSCHKGLRPLTSTNIKTGWWLVKGACHWQEPHLQALHLHTHNFTFNSHLQNLVVERRKEGDKENLIE